MNLDEFIQYISNIETPDTVVNPYAVYREGIDSLEGSSATRLAHLRHYLNHRLDTAQMLLIAEAPGYQGARFSGLAMTCERTLLGHRDNVATADVLGEGIQPVRTSHLLACRYATQRNQGIAEPTAAVVWGEIMQRGLARQIVLWNAFPFHPHNPDVPLSNRTPSAQEVEDHSQILVEFLGLFPNAQRIVAVGNTARDLLAQKEIDAPLVRHPANRGTNLFRQQINQIFDQYF